MTASGSRRSTRINKGNVKGLKLAYAVPLGGGAGNECNEATPLVEDGFLYITDSWGVLYKIDGTLGRCRPHRLAHGSQAGAAGDTTAAPPSGAISSSRPPTRRPRIIATDKDTGKVVWETNVSYDQPRCCRSPARRSPIKDKIIVGAAGGDRGVRDWIAALDAATGKLLWRKYTIPAPGEPGSETWKDKNNAWQTGGGAVWVTGTYDPATNQTIWGIGNPVPMMDPDRRGRATISTPTARSPGIPTPAR